VESIHHASKVLNNGQLGEYAVLRWTLTSRHEFSLGFKQF